MRRLFFPLALAWIATLTVQGRAADSPSYTRTEDVVYGRKSGTALTMDVFRPKGQSNGLGVIFVVSGGWYSSHDAIGPGFITPLTDRGYTVFAVVHGSQPKFTIPEVLNDMHRAVRFIRAHAKDYGIDPDRLGIYGGSAGGHLSLMQGTAGDKGDPKAQDPVDRVSSRVQAVACFFPPTDFLNYGKPGEDALGRGILKDFAAPFDFHEFDPQRKVFVPVSEEKKRDIGRKVSPINHVSPDDPPTLIIHGDADQLVPIQQAEIMVEKLKGAGVEAKLVVKEGGGHGWANWPNDVRQLADWFDQHLAKKGDSGNNSRAGSGTSAGSLPEPWSDRDIGDVQVPGSARQEDGTFVITGTLDVWGPADGFHFVFRPLEGDGQVVARVTEVENTHEHAKGGVMIRDSLDAGARHAAIVVTPNDGAQFLRRKETDGVTTYTSSDRNKGKFPAWVKLVRDGDQLTAFVSEDGHDWVKVGSDTVPLGKRAYVGLIASSHRKDATCRAKLDHVTVE